MQGDLYAIFIILYGLSFYTGSCNEKEVIMKKTLLLSAVLTAILMVLSMAAVFADETTYTVNYETYSSDPTYCTPITCTWDQADLGYKGHTRSDGRWVSVQEEFADDGLNFLGWYTDESFQTQYDPDMTYSQLAGGDMSRTSVTLYAKLGHEHGGIAYVPWGLTDRMPDEPGNYYLYTT